MLYVPTVFILGSIFFNQLEKISNKTSDYYKVTLNYKISTTSTKNEIEKAYKDYESNIQSYLSIYEFKNIIEFMTESSRTKKQSNETPKEQINILLNFAPSMIILLTALMFLWSFKSLNIFRCIKDKETNS